MIAALDFYFQVRVSFKVAAISIFMLAEWLHVSSSSSLIHCTNIHDVHTISLFDSDTPAFLPLLLGSSNPVI